jgi:hypothetical protein
MATGFPSQPKTAEQAADQAAGGMAPWKKWALGGGALAGAAGAGYLYGSSQNRQQQMSAWLDDIIQFDRGSYAYPFMKRLHKAEGMTLAQRSFTNPFTKEVVETRSNAPKGSIDIHQAWRNSIAKRIKKIKRSDPGLYRGFRGFSASGKPIEFGETPKIFESAEDPIEFDSRPRNEVGQFQPYSGGGPDANAMATVYKMPQEHAGLGSTILKGGALALTGGALGQVGGEIGKKGTSKVKELLQRFKKAAPAVKK